MAETLLRHLARAAFTALLLAVVVLLGQLPLGRPSGEAVLRLALRTVQTRLEICREPSAEELEKLPIHMRRTRDCEERGVDYRVRLEIDGETVLDETVSPGGLRRDRPLIIDRQLRLAPGSPRLELRLEPVAPGVEDASALEAWERLPRYAVERPVELAADRVTLITIDEAAGGITIVR